MWIGRRVVPGSAVFDHEAQSDQQAAISKTIPADR
jgi:hypothetical protein